MTRNTKTTAALADLQLLTIAPAELHVRDQARGDATPDDELIASVRAHGIIQPPVIEPYDDGYAIVAGHRRVGAAIAAGLDAITCVLRPTPAGDAAITLEQQIVENERRKALSAKDLAAGYEKLTLFGLRPEDIAASLGEKTDRVQAGLKITGSKKVGKLIEEQPSIDFEQAATIAEFDQHPKIQKRLIESATTRPENFHRDVESARKDRDVEVRVAELRSQLKDEGVKCAGTETYGGTYWAGPKQKGRSLQRLGIDPADHVDCPGHAAIIANASTWGYVHDDTQIEYVCTDYREYGHEASPSTTREKTPEEIEAEQERERQRAEHEAARQLMEANTRTRRAWIHGHLTTGRLRPTATHFELVADAIAISIEYSEAAEEHITLELLTGQPHDRWSNEVADELRDLITTRKAPPLRVIIANALAFLDLHRYDPYGVKYFTALEQLGYTLTDTDREEVATAEQARIDALADDEDTDDEDDDQ